MALPFPQFARTVAQLLARMGYRDVRLMGATYGKGRNRFGGLDLMARLPNDLTQATVIAQVKQYRGSVPRTYVDELRGAMLRLGAQQGLIVTTSSFAPAAAEASSAARHSLPVRLMDGAELAALLTLYRLETGDPADGSGGGVHRGVRADLPVRPVSGGSLPTPPASPTEARPPCPGQPPRAVTVTIRVEPSTSPSCP